MSIRAVSRTNESRADGEGEDDDVESASSPYSELLADAILKRSSTIRPSKKNGKKENSPLDKQEGAEEVELLTEFTFPSLSDVYYRTASRTESSISSSLSSSPPSTTATVPDLIGDPKCEEDKASLPSVIEKAEGSDPGCGEARSRARHPIVQETRHRGYRASDTEKRRSRTIIDGLIRTMTITGT
jgi:hypothetical protein